MHAPAIDFALFVTPIEGQIVHRYGTGSYIGVSRQDKPQSKKITVKTRTGEKRERVIMSPWSSESVLEWDTKTIVPIPRVEFERYRKEYTRAIAPGGGLKMHTLAQWEAQRDARKAKAQKAADDAKAEKAAAAADAKREAAELVNTTEA